MPMGRTIQILNDMVRDGVIDTYAIGGAVAAINYIEPVATEDLDILVSFADQRSSLLVTLGPITSYLAGLGYTEWKDEGLLIEGWPVQFLPISDALDNNALENAITFELEFGEMGTVPARILSPEFIVATAVRVGRPKDFVRINSFLEEDQVDIDLLEEVLDRHDLREKWASFCQKTGRDDPLGISSKP